MDNRDKQRRDSLKLDYLKKVDKEISQEKSTEQEEIKEYETIVGDQQKKTGKVTSRDFITNKLLG